MAGHNTGIRFKIPKMREGNRPEIVPPLVILMLVPLSAFWLFVTLVYGLIFRPEPHIAAAIAVVGGFSPMAIAYGIVTNKRWTRLLTVVSLYLFAVLMALDGNLPAVFFSRSSIACYFVLWLGLAVYLYKSRASRAYYLLITGKPLPDALKDVKFSYPDGLLSYLGSVLYVSEFVMVVLALLIFFGTLLMITPIH